MRKCFILVALTGFLYSGSVFAGDLWKRVDPASKSVQAANVNKYLLYAGDNVALRSLLFAMPANETQVLELPMPDGSLRKFNVWPTPMMPAALAAKYPEIKTFTGVAEDDPTVTAKLDYTLYGFHAMVFDHGEVSFVDPSDNNNAGYYVVHYKRDEQMHADVSSHCIAEHIEPAVIDGEVEIHNAAANKTVNGYQLRTYRLALSCSHQYASAATSISTPLISQVLSKMTTTMNRVNGVYEKELSVTMVFVDNEDTLIWNTTTGGPNGPDPFSAIDGNPGQCLVTNQQVCDDRIGSPNYDLGHVFTTNAGGFSLIGVICKNGEKAQSVTGQPNPTGDGFDIDYVVHELGHEFGAEHTFNNGVSGSCAGSNVNWQTAYEPGSGSTIMAYAGICTPDNIQPHSDDYFHAASLREIQSYINAGGNTCAVKTSTGNKIVSLPAFGATYTIPSHTPFELSVPNATDSVSSSSITYCWEQWNLGDLGKTFAATQSFGPIFRSYKPSASPLRVFPRMSQVLADKLSDAGTNNGQGEKVPEVARNLVFKLTVRNILNGKGCFLIPDDSIRLDVVSTAGFKVTSQTDSTATYVGGSMQTITWDVVGTNNAPVNASTVDIYMSEDGGYNWPHMIGTFPNTGTVSVPLPNPDTTVLKARIKVKGSGNVFFNVNKCNFSVTHSDGTDTTIRIYPVPAHTTLRISSGNKGLQQFRIYNAGGRLVFWGEVNGLFDVPVHLWASGMYFIRMIGTKGEKTVMKFVVQ